MPRGVGNQVSCEFTLLYRFHSVISQRDEKWLNEFFKNVIFSDLNKDLDKITPVELWQGMMKYERMIPKDPSAREFANLKRGPDGKFKDEDLVKILNESMQDPAGKLQSLQLWSQKDIDLIFFRLFWSSPYSKGP